MDKEYDPLLETETGESELGCPEGTVLITVDDFYDLLMEQQEQM